MSSLPEPCVVTAGQLHVAYLTWGDRGGWPCVLSHGFPYDVNAYSEVAPLLATAGAWVVVPYLRGYGPTRFVAAETPRSGEQAVLAADLLALMDALHVERPVLAGYDWGGRASCIVAALWPERVAALVSGNSYNIQNIARASEPLAAKDEAALWYQYYFHSERGRAGATFAHSAAAFNNPDFVDVVIHSYRHRFGLVAGDPAVAGIEARLTAQPAITVPTIAIDGDSDGVNAGTRHHAKKFTGPFAYRVFKDAGHNLPQERPAAWAQAVLDARVMARRV
jgi:pimeloyl-ACP methyl ester carboxylesterase